MSEKYKNDVSFETSNIDYQKKINELKKEITDMLIKIPNKFTKLLHQVDQASEDIPALKESGDNQNPALVLFNIGDALKAAGLPDPDQANSTEEERVTCFLNLITLAYEYWMHDNKIFDKAEQVCDENLHPFVSTMFGDMIQSTGWLALIQANQHNLDCANGLWHEYPEGIPEKRAQQHGFIVSVVSQILNEDEGCYDYNDEMKEKYDRKAAKRRFKKLKKLSNKLSKEIMAERTKIMEEYVKNQKKKEDDSFGMVYDPLSNENDK